MIVTTGGRYNEETLQKARDIAMRYGLEFAMRRKRSVKELNERYNDDVMIVGNDGLSIAPQSCKESVKYHPNFSMVRAKRLLKNENDALVEAAELESGMSFLDCTMGLGADSVIASMAVGNQGKVTALEHSFILYLLTKEGLASYNADNDIINEAMRNIKALHVNYETYLKTLADNSFDVIYFDPMFDEEISKSQSLRTITPVTHTETLSETAVEEAKRVAAEKVVLKDHFRSKRFEQFGFEQQIRKTSKVHYGIISTNVQID